MNSNDVQSLIDGLYKKTSQKKITWRADGAPLAIIRGTDNIIPIFLRAVFDGVNYALFEVREQRFDGEYERLYWINYYTLAILNDNDTVLWDHSENVDNGQLKDLFSVARSALVDLSKILRSF